MQAARFRIKTAIAVTAIIAICTVVSLLVSHTAYAAVSTVQTATATPSYENPDTGVIEDSGGTDNKALGESMVSGTNQPYALVEMDTSGNYFVTLRLKQAQYISDVTVSSDPEHDGTFGDAQAGTVTNTDTANDMADVRAAIVSPSSTLRVSFYVQPMGRYVIYYVTLSNFVDGNTQGFVPQIVAGEGQPDPAPSTNDGSDAAEGNANIHEYDGEGNEVTGAQDSTQADIITYVLIAVIIVALIVIVGIFYYLVRGKKRQKAAKAAAAAAAARGVYDPIAPAENMNAATTAKISEPSKTDRQDNGAQK